MQIRKNIDGLNFPILIEDIAGQEKYEYINSIYYNNADGIILMYNIDNKSSFDCIVNIQNMNYIDLISNNRQLLLIGNKVNGSSERQVPTREAETFANNKGIMFREIDCVNRLGTEEAFKDLIRIIMPYYFEKKKRIENKEGQLNLFTNNTSNKVLHDEFTIVLTKQDRIQINQKNKCIY